MNVAQLHATNQQVALNTTDIHNLQNGTDGYLQVNNSASRLKPSATGADSLAAGGDAVASGAGSMAAGMGAQALASNSVAIGNGSIADRADSVSVGSASMARQITNVAAGTSATDAVNLGQLQSAMGDTLATANAYTDARLGQLDFDLARTRRDAAGGTASALAVAGIPQPMDRWHWHARRGRQHLAGGTCVRDRIFEGVRQWPGCGAYRGIDEYAP